MKRIFVKIYNWLFSIPKSDKRESSVISVSITRRGLNGDIYKFSLDGDAAREWGWLLEHRQIYGFEQLLPSWKIDLIEDKDA